MKGGIFQVVLLVVCGVGVTIAVLMFSGVIPGFGDNRSGSRGTIVLWGTLPTPSMSNLVSDFNRENETYQLRYVEKVAATLEEEFVDALARNVGPDLILLPDYLVISQRDKIYPIPPNTLSPREFRDTYAEIGEVYALPEGIIALPLFIDPLVMYYNRDLYAGAGLPAVPTTWSGLIKNHPSLTKLGDRGLVLESGLAFGTANNITRAKDILVLLMLQAGSPITTQNSTTGQFESALMASAGGSSGLIPAIAALDFYTSFSNPLTVTYSWNESMPLEVNAFAAGKLAHYFGYASELSALRGRNPNLNMDVALVPQRDNITRRLTLGRLTGVAVVRNSRNLSGAYAVASRLVAADYADRLARLAGTTPARRDLLGRATGDLYQDIFYRATIMSRTWLDPNQRGSKIIFDEMIQNKNINRNQGSAIVRVGSDKLNLLIRR
jgi:ABC-type glycerol-3-phosphate transport system substrate-binding protein